MHGAGPREPSLSPLMMASAWTPSPPLPSLAVVGEFTEILEDILSTRLEKKETKYTVGMVNDLLNRITRSDGLERQKVFAEIFKEFSAREQKWIARIIIGDVMAAWRKDPQLHGNNIFQMKMGVKHESFLKYLHENANEYFSHCCDLRKVVAR
jgi:hypothetical protein